MTIPVPACARARPRTRRPPTGLAWAEPANPHPFADGETGATATAWGITERRTDADFFARHRLTDLLSWLDSSLEQQGRLSGPMRWTAAADKYGPAPREDALAEIGRELRAMNPQPNDAI